jgi:hypothetical protein
MDTHDNVGPNRALCESIAQPPVAVACHKEKREWLQDGQIGLTSYDTPHDLQMNS